MSELIKQMDLLMPTEAEQSLMSDRELKWFHAWLNAKDVIWQQTIELSELSQVVGSYGELTDWILKHPPGPAANHADWIVQVMNQAHRATRLVKAAENPQAHEELKPKKVSDTKNR